jgi:hypothetical protein
LRLRRADGSAVAGAPVTFSLDSAPTATSTDADGCVATPIHPTSLTAEFAIDDGEPSTVFIGGLDPLEESSGWQARLVNLGYLEDVLPDLPESEARSEDDLHELRAAIEEFQCDHELPKTGEMDAATRAKLSSEHGC